MRNFGHATIATMLRRHISGFFCVTLSATFAQVCGGVLRNIHAKFTQLYICAIFAHMLRKVYFLLRPGLREQTHATGGFRKPPFALRLRSLISGEGIP